AKKRRGGDGSIMLLQDVRDLIASSIPSVWTLEALLLMRRVPEREWREPELIRELRGSALVVSNALRALTAAGLVLETSPGCFCYRPARAELGTTVDQIAAAYLERKYAVTQAILAAPNDRIRTFADAFRIKKD
ncbi:MAG: hypothetical protein ACREFQ_00135, partial [Stellaceae bacterium]